MEKISFTRKELIAFAKEIAKLAKADDMEHVVSLKNKIESALVVTFQADSPQVLSFAKPSTNFVHVPNNNPGQVAEHTAIMPIMKGI